MSASQLQTLSPKYVNKEVGSIFLFRNNYVFISIDLGVMVVGKRLRDVLSNIYSRIISIFFDKNGNLIVKYETPIEDVDGTLIDYTEKIDVWQKMW